MDATVGDYAWIGRIEDKPTYFVTNGAIDGQEICLVQELKQGDKTVDCWYFDDFKSYMWQFTCDQMYNMLTQQTN